MVEKDMRDPSETVFILELDDFKNAMQFAQSEDAKSTVTEAGLAEKPQRLLFEASPESRALSRGSEFLVRFRVSAQQTSVWQIERCYQTTTVSFPFSE